MNKCLEVNLKFIIDNNVDISNYDLLDSSQVLLKKYLINEDQKSKIILDDIYQKLNQNEYPTIQKLPFLMGYDTHFNKMHNFYELISEFKSHMEDSENYLILCFLFADMMNEMMYDEYREIQAIFKSKLDKVLVDQEINDTLASLIGVGLIKEYLTPKYIDLIKHYQSQNEVFNNLKQKMRKMGLL